MTQEIPKNMLPELSRFIIEHTGLYFPPKKYKALNKGLTAAAKALGYGPEDFSSHLLSSSVKNDTINTTVGYLTIGETYFLRDKNLFQVLGDKIIPEIIRDRKRKEKKINIWSAGCATGEEPYSIAILIDHLFPGLKGWEINIIGTEINPVFLEKARRGVYSHWSLRETPQQIIKDYFISTRPNCFELVEEIKKKVRFFHLNLMEKRYRLRFGTSDPADIILCRNVLMYFNNRSRNHVIKNLSAMLAENGWLITGPAESGFVQSPDLSTVKLANLLFHQKKTKQKDKKSSFPAKGEQGIKKGRYPHLQSAAAKHKRDGVTVQTREIITRGSNYNIYQMALRDYKKGDYRKSAERLSSLLEKGLKNENHFLMGSDSMVLLARSYANIGNLEKARGWCEKAIQSQKLNPEIYFLRSTIAQASGDINTSIRSLRRALYLDPEFIMAHFTLGLLLKQEGRHREGKKSMKNALSLLETKDPVETLPYSEGMTVKGLIQTIQEILHEVSHK